MRRVIVLAAALAALVAASGAGAANYKMLLGEQTRPPAGTPKSATLDAYFPKSVTINAGDSVTFQSASFHTATYSPTRPPFGHGIASLGFVSWSTENIGTNT